MCLRGQVKLRRRKKILKQETTSAAYEDTEYEPYKTRHMIYAILTAIMPTATVAVAVGYWAAVRNPDNFQWDQPVKHGANAVVRIDLPHANQLHGVIKARR